MIKLNVGQMVDYPLHSSVFVMDLAVLLFHRPPFLFSLAMFALLLWLTIFFVVNSERSERFRVVFERKPSSAKPAAIAAPVVEAPAPAPAVEPAPAAAVEAQAVVEAPAAAVAEAQPAAPSRSSSSSRRAAPRRKG